ncbi:MAG: hypothetical protein O2944_04675, partial [Proteobacteria bacterium]|nr:hypothetical protein [Pseudomonadota bacterium]
QRGAELDAKSAPQGVTIARDFTVPETYARVSGLVDLADPRHAKFNDIATMAVTEILDLVR